ncbi:MAG: CDP-alcohol phosphatidyltransferase family protein [Eubacteriales bacterium]|jgi:CDP-diacylglycerol--serine O-phosphatidyltransferase
MKSSKLRYLPNALTFANMAIGVFIVCFLMISQNSIYDVKLVCYMIYIAAIFDMLDGHLARYLNASSEMGKQLDSFADFITFGVAPVAIFISNTKTAPWYILLILLCYPLAGGFRLARYNLQKNCECFAGLPITAAGFIMNTTLLINRYLHSEITAEFTVLFLVLSLVLSVLMISKIRVNRIIKVKRDRETVLLSDS